MALYGVLMTNMAHFGLIYLGTVSFEPDEVVLPRQQRFLCHADLALGHSRLYSLPLWLRHLGCCIELYTSAQRHLTSSCGPEDSNGQLHTVEGLKVLNQNASIKHS